MLELDKLDILQETLEEQDITWGIQYAIATEKGEHHLICSWFQVNKILDVAKECDIKFQTVYTWEPEGGR